MDLLIGTSNKGKLEEFQMMLASLPVRLLSLKDVGLGDMDVDENAGSLEGNAELKVRAYSKASGLITLADDTGLEIDALGGEPGIYPARYGGPTLTMADRRQKVLSQMVNIPDEQRTARFICVIALANPQTDELITVRGVCPGRIAQAEDTSGGGFGYDPVFIPEGYDQTFSGLPPEEKNRISHRGRASQLLLPSLSRLAAESA